MQNEGKSKVWWGKFCRKGRVCGRNLDEGIRLIEEIWLNSEFHTPKPRKKVSDTNSIENFIYDNEIQINQNN